MEQPFLVPSKPLCRTERKVDVMTKYEYVTVPLLTHATKQILDTWGSDGWELIQVIPAPGGGDQLVAYMKREVA